MEPKTDYDYVIVGAGPAGLQMAYFLQKAGRTYVVYEAADKAATFFKDHPRHGKLISINKKNNLFTEDDFNMRHDWNSLLSDDEEMKFTKYSDDLYPKPADLLRYMNDYANRFQLNIKYNTKVTKISKPKSIFTVTAESKDSKVTSCTSKCVLMATGAVEENLPEEIENIELADTYSKHDLDKKKYKNKRVMVMGGGNSAFEVADYLSDTAAFIHVTFVDRVRFAWNTHFVGDLRAVNTNIIDMYHLKSLHSIFASPVLKIVKTKSGRFAVTMKDINTHWSSPGWIYFDIEYDHVISCLGWRYINRQIFDDTIKVDLVKEKRYPKLSNCWETGTENLFYIGGAMGSIDNQAASGFIHGFRYNIRTLHNLLENRLFNKNLPCLTLPERDLQAIAKTVIERATISASLYQLNGFLCDVMIFDDKDCTKYYTDLPIKHVMERPEFRDAQHAFIFHLSYGADKFGTTKPEDDVHSPDFFSNRCVSFIHPHIEYFSKGKYVDQTELQESLIVRYDEWSNASFPQWASSTNENYIKFFINDKMGWTDEVFNLMPISEEVMRKKFVPLTEEERSRLPPLYEKSECKPSQDLLPKDSKPVRQRKLRPTEDEMVEFAKVRQ